MSEQVIDLDDDSFNFGDSVNISEDCIDLDDSENFVCPEHELGMMDTVRILLTDTGDLKFYEIREREPFEKIFKEISQIYNVEPKDVMITKNNVQVSPIDTMDSLKLSVFDKVRAFVFKKSKEDIIKELKEPSKDKLKISLQRDNKERNKLHFYINESEKFKIIYEVVSEELKIPESSIKIKFDDEVVSPDQSLKSLDVDDHVVMDLIIQSKIN